MHYVYILFSEKAGRYYTGETYDVAERLERHNTGYYDEKWTESGKPWRLVLAIECTDKKQALCIERHIKAMKSKKYIENLVQYPEMVEKLKARFAQED